jgi:HTH-type transcriptional regulator/antitoxin HigA
MDHLKIVKTPEEHEAALERLMALMDADPEEGSREADQLEVLAMLIDQYEQRQFPINLPDPASAIRFRMEQQGLKSKDLLPFIGSASKVSEVLNGGRAYRKRRQ